MSRATRCRLSPAEIERYCRIVLVELERQAPKLRRRWGQIGEDFLEKAPEHLFEKLRAGCFDPAHGDFLPWRRVVLRRLLYSVAREHRRRERRFRLTPFKYDPQRSSPLATAARRNDVEGAVQEQEVRRLGAASFSANDLRTLKQWNSFDRFVLLSLCDLWRKVPRRNWQSLVEQLRRQGLIHQPIPIEQLALADSPRQRISILAKTLGMRSNTLSARWRRRKHLLAQLDYLRELRAAI